MAGFLYYLPGQTRGSLTDRNLADMGLAYALERPWTAAQVTTGPDAAGGLILGPNNHPDVGYYQDRQQWQALLAGPWVGWLPADKPGPADLARSEQLSGQLVRLGDGQEWLVPLARGQSEQDGALVWFCALERKMELTAAGNWAPADVVERWAQLWRLAETWQAARWGANIDDAPEGADNVSLAVEMTNDEAAAGAVLALQANYRLGPVEAGILGLLTSRTMVAVLDALIDVATVWEYLKKKTAASGPADPGG